MKTIYIYKNDNGGCGNAYTKVNTAEELAGYMGVVNNLDEWHFTASIEALDKEALLEIEDFVAGRHGEAFSK